MAWPEDSPEELSGSPGTKQWEGKGGPTAGLLGLGSETAQERVQGGAGLAAAPHPLPLLQLAHVLPTEENFLLLFRCQQLKSCEEFMKVRQLRVVHALDWEGRLTTVSSLPHRHGGSTTLTTAASSRRRS